MTAIAWINEQTMICENVSSDERPLAEISIPGYILIDPLQTPAAGWAWDAQLNDWVQVAQNIGEGGISDTYENGVLVEPKPTEPPTEQGGA